MKRYRSGRKAVKDAKKEEQAEKGDSAQQQGDGVGDDINEHSAVTGSAHAE